MRVYLDTSVLVAAHTREPATAQVQAWLSKRNADDFIVSTWALVECESALSIKERRGELTHSARLAASAAIGSFAARLAPLVTPVEADFKSAGHFCTYAASRLRAGDALHLALALRAKSQSLATLDQVLDENATLNGLRVVPLSE